MTNEEKIKEIVREQPYATQNDNYATMIEYGARKMAEWKDKQFSTENYKYYDPTKRMTRDEAIANPQPVCVLIDSDGQPKGVLVQALEDKFVIDLKDFNGGKGMDWNDAMTALKAEGKTAFTQQQAYLILYLHALINSALVSVGGDELNCSYWANTEYSLHFAWYLYFGSRNFYDTGCKYYLYFVRAITNL